VEESEVCITAPPSRAVVPMIIHVHPDLSDIYSIMCFSRVLKLSPLKVYLTRRIRFRDIQQPWLVRPNHDSTTPPRTVTAPEYAAVSHARTRLSGRSMPAARAPDFHRKGRRLGIGTSSGGHLKSVSCVCFMLFWKRRPHVMGARFYDW
jgi:hypothetical protein